jgi:hypothetical protein
MPGNKVANSKIISGSVNYVRGKMGLKSISNLHRWLLSRAKQAVKLGWRIK